ncbi:sesquipedalian-1 [Syngnathus typhle]|uniref:sesquipedalian-1 n=1 Tax=Syngnathus typhle TaxID=161592 RepID=UPI002A6B16AA|nr:sesquipedalian-1 [Syngnathus typhle]XP_061158795.1 sesquipedalian-1 [Syngnathus typhle]
MKLHKKILTHYHSCTSLVDKEGFLFKKKQRSGSYHRRWLVLKGNLLFYQERPADRHLLGVIVLEGCAVRRVDADGRFCFSLLFRGPEEKSYQFAAADEGTLANWLRALLSASHRYLSLLLRDLHVQYNNLTQDGGELKHHQGYDGSPASNLNFGPAAAAAVMQKSPKPWHRWNAHVTPLNVPTALLLAEWPLVGCNVREEFGQLHHRYGQDVKKAREEWLTSRQPPEENLQEDLIDLT